MAEAPLTSEATVEIAGSLDFTCELNTSNGSLIGGLLQRIRGRKKIADYHKLPAWRAPPPIRKHYVA